MDGNDEQKRIMIPQRLRDTPGLVFIKVKARDKIPIEKEWQKEGGANYAPYSPDIKKHIENGGNYGVVCKPPLIVIDADCDQMVDFMEKCSLPTTFTASTAKGSHYYFFCDDWGETSKPLTYLGKHVGDIKADRGFVVGPTCIHPSGSRYEVMKHISIATVKRTDIEGTLGFLFKDRRTAATATATPPHREHQHTLPDGDDGIDGIRIEDVINLHGMKNVGMGIYQGPHPVHDSTTGTNFSVNINDGTWFCFRHQCGGRGFHLFAVLEGVVDCGDDVHNRVLTIRRDKFVEAKQLAIERGLIKITTQPTQPIPPPQPTPLTTTAPTETKDATPPQPPPLNPVGDDGKVKRADPHVMASLLLEKFSIKTDSKTNEIYVYDEEDGVYKREDEYHILKGQLRKWEAEIGARCSRAGYNETLFLIEASTYVSPESIEGDPDYMHLGNCILNTRTMATRNFTPDIFSVTKIPTDIVPDAKCPAFEKFLSDITATDRDFLVIQELMGWILRKRYHPHKAVAFLGAGRNGKSKLLSAIERLVGRHNCAGIPPQSFNRQFAVSNLRGRLLNSCLDISDKTLKDTDIFKQLTGEDTITADIKFKKPTVFSNTAKLVFASNFLPASNDDSEGFYRRWIMVPFVKRFDGKDDDPYILEKITTKEELEGMLIFALQGLTRLKEQGHFTGDLDANETRERWKYMVDPIVRFMMEFVENTMESSDMIPVSELRDHYIRYSGKRVSPAVFNDRVTMAAETWQSVHGGKGQKIRVWRGIRWKNGPPASITPGKDDENGGGRSTEIKANCAFDKNVDHYKSLLDMDTIRPGVIDSGEKIVAPATPKGVTLSEYAKRVSVRNDGGGDDVEDDVEDADDEPEEVGHDFVY